MTWFVAALFAVPILATLWAIGFGVMAAREKKIIWRCLCGVQALIGVVFAASAWLMFGLMSSGRAMPIAKARPRLLIIPSRVGFFLLAIAALALVLVERQRRNRLQGKP